MRSLLLGLSALGALAALAAFAAPARAETITFGEAGVPSGENLDNTGFYSGLEFTNAYQFGSSGLLIPDGYGIANYFVGSTDLYVEMTVAFLNGASSVTFEWVTQDSNSYVNGVLDHTNRSFDFFATAYDSNGTMIGEFQFSGLNYTGSQHGTATLTGNISKIVFNDNHSVGDAGYIAVNTLTYSAVPEPATLALFGLGAGAFAWRRRRMARAK